MSSVLNVTNSISNQLFKLIFGLYCLIAVSVTIIQIVEEYRYTQQTIAEELKTYEHIFGPVLAKALWNLDREQVNDVTQGFSEVPIIVSVKIERLQDNKLVPYAGINSAEYSLAITDQFSYSFPIEYSIAGIKQPLGQATLYSDSSIVFNRVQLGFIFLIINALIKGIALWLIFWWASKKLLIRPLETLTQSISNLKFDNLSSFKLDLNIEKENELSIIEQSFSDMVAEISKAKHHVSNFNFRLENEVKERTLALEKSTNEAEALTQIAQTSARVKSDFLATMSHELRTPMNGIQGMLYLLNKSELNSTQKQQVEVASKSAQGLLTLINDILDLSKLESGEYEINQRSFELYPLFSELINSFSLNNHNLHLILDADNLRSVQAIGDPERIRQILTNLIDNAIKFTPHGKIKVSTVLIETFNKNEFSLSVSVQDTGIGISPENIGHVFDSFTQADSTTTREYGGTGLGLSICKQLCHLMDGEISVTSEEGKGSCFKFIITLKKINNNH